MRTLQPDTTPPQLQQETVQMLGSAAIQRYRSGFVVVTLLWAQDKGAWRVSHAQLTPIVPDSASVRRTIDDNNARYIAALKQGDAAALAAFYTSDGVVMNPNMPAWRGADGMRQGFAGFLTRFAVIDAKLATQDVIITPWYAIERGTYQWTLHPKTGAGPDVSDNGKYLTVWELQDDGSWKISRDINNSDRGGSM